MQLKITTDYAIRMILYLAQNESVIVSATEITQAMKIPHSYLIQIGAVLKKSGLIQAHSGRLGGYSLAEPSDSITLYDIVAVMESTTLINRCLESDSYCSRSAAEFCPVRKSYCLLQQHINNFLQYLTIAELLKNHISHEGPPPSSARAPQAAELSSAFLIAEKRS